MRAPLFKGLTRPVSFMGLPMAYVATLLIVVVGGFIATLSILYLMISFILGYVTLRLLAAYDARIFDVLIVTIRATPIKKSQLQGRGVTYGP
ncbi:VirB3 family type IV secretion system protein [Roseibium suaedae]|uniref:Type IV secretion system protein VirB3 n=1 Tax=Roseibium suaedae TaxID=735517 RepID=A0A1M7PJP2_9HYPH|nr:VirB3 family type IV secretion system protein [Roseibium suaedae]SHN17296.1 type IV secretion system protein VirB3 [Roseibium suaedae]